MRLFRLCSIVTATAIAIAAGAFAPTSALAKQPAPAREPAPSGSSAPQSSRTKKSGAGSSESNRGDAGKASTKAERASRGAQSIGAPNRGRLAGGMRLRPTKHLKLRPGGRSWGLPALVRLLRRTADDVAKKHKNTILFVGDLSAKAGGPIEGHNSHQSGRDADIGFFVANSSGKPVSVKHFVAFDNAGKGRDFTWARFDDARNWTLIEALLKDDQASVRYIFVANGLRARLLAYAEKKQAPKDIIARAASVMMSPRDTEMHDDHFHVRLLCPESMRGVCTEESLARDGAPTIAAAGRSAVGGAAGARSGAALGEAGIAVVTAAPGAAKQGAVSEGAAEPASESPAKVDPSAADVGAAQGTP